MNIKKYYLLTTEFPPFYGGGISTYAWHTSKMLTEQDIDVTVFLPDSSLDEDLKIDENGKLRVVRFKIGKKPFYSFLGSVFAQSYHFSEVLKSFIEKEGLPDIVEIQDYLGIGYYTLQRKYTLEPPFKDLQIIMTLHTPKFLCDYYNEAPLYKFPDYTIGEAERWCIKAVDGVISPSSYLANEINKWSELKGVSPEIIHNPYYLTGNFEKKSGRDLVFLGRLEKRKGILEVLDYMVEIWKEGIEIPIHLIGGDTLFHPKGVNLSEFIKEKYRNYVEEGYIVFVGKLKPEELKKRLIIRTKIGIIGSVFENFPYTLLDLIDSGAVPLISDCGGHSEVIEDGKNGYIFSHSNPETFKKKLTEIIGLSDIDLKNLRINALNKIRELCSYESVFNKKMAFMEKIFSKRIYFSVYPFIRECCENNFESFSEDHSISINEGLLSIIIPYYNLGGLLLETIDSVEKSNYKDKEIIVVNDGSNDMESIAVLEEISRKKSYIKIVNKENQGLASARNTGATIAKGEYLAFLDADDLVHPDYYSIAVNILKNYKNVSFVGCWVKYFEGSEATWPAFNPEFPYFLFHNSICSGSLVLKKKDFLRYGLNDPNMKYGMEDYDFVMNMLKHGKRGIIIPKELFYYRIRKSSMLRQLNSFTYLYLYNKISEKHSDLYKKYSVELFNLQNANGPAYLSDNPTWESYVHSNFETKPKDDNDQIFIPIEIKSALKKLWRYRTIRFLGRLLTKLIK